MTTRWDAETPAGNGNVHGIKHASRVFPFQRYFSATNIPVTMRREKRQMPD
ncbi:hypothetical protein [Bartonella sp. LJL80]